MRHKKSSFRFLLLTVVLAWTGTEKAPDARGGDLPAEGDVKPVEVVRTNDYSEGVVVDHAGKPLFLAR